MVDVTMLPLPRLAEVGPRDGLQNEAVVVPTEAKISFIDTLSESGVKEISAGAFGSRPPAPQLADSSEVFENMRRKEGVAYLALAFDAGGLESAIAAEADKVEVLCAASETFSQRTLGAPIAQTIELLRPLVGQARKARGGRKAAVKRVPRTSSMTTGPGSWRPKALSTWLAATTAG